MCNICPSDFSRSAEQRIRLEHRRYDCCKECQTADDALRLTAVLYPLVFPRRIGL